MLGRLDMHLYEAYRLVPVAQIQPLSVAGPCEQLGHKSALSSCVVYSVVVNRVRGLSTSGKMAMWHVFCVCEGPTEHALCVAWAVLPNLRLLFLFK